MTEFLILSLCWLSGVFLGAIFFGGLWWTVQRALSSPRPALWFLGSLILRTAIVLGGFSLLLGPHWQRMIVCLIGFTMARFAIVWITTPSAPHSVKTPPGLNHAS